MIRIRKNPKSFDMYSFSGSLGIVWIPNLAEREGFEPSKQFPTYTRSRRAPSTTRPPLQEMIAFRKESETDASFFTI